MKRSVRGPTTDARPTRVLPRALRILVVEDHPDVRRGLEVFLASLGHRPQSAGNLHEALAVAGSSPLFDLLLSDVQLPDGDGRTLPFLLEQAGHRPRQAIAMSGYGGADDGEKSRAAGFRAHLVKPGSRGELEAALNEVAAL